MRKRPLTDQSGAGQGQAADQGPAPAAVEAQETPKAGEQRAAGRKRSRFALRNWRVSWRLIALIAIPTITAMYFGGLRIDEAVHSADGFQQVERLANLGKAVTHLANSMEDESNALAGYIAAGRNKGTMPPAVIKQEAVTNAAAGQVKSLASGVGSSYPAQVRDDLSAALDRVNDLSHYRAAALDTKAPALTVINNYSGAIADLFTLNDQIAEGTSDTTLSNNVRALGALERDEDQATQQRAILYSALVANRFEPGAALALSNAFASQAAELAEFQSAATISETQSYQNTVAGAAVDDAGQMEQQAIASGSNSTTPSVSLPTAPAKFTNAAVAWDTDMSATVGSIRTVEQGLVGQIISRSQTLHAAATRTAVETGILVLAVLIIVLLITIVVARSMVRPLRKLRTGALEVAGLRLPETVRRMSETDGEGVSLEVEPIDVDSSDEIGEVARAFDQVHREALRLAANEAALRGNVNAMFVNLSRRSQSLVERQIRLIDDLEQGEQDPERLASLFQMDHLATRMRRNSENLLVLAGHDETRRWNQQVALVDVLRAALSEIEQYERVTVTAPPRISVRAQAVSDVVHLTAELVENATSFSAAESPVTITARSLTSGGLLLEIADQGVGMAEDEMAHANWRLDNPPTVDVAVSRRMGLFVVARLAARHGIRVRLRPAENGGLVALVWLPDEAITPGASGPGGLPRRNPVPSQDAAPGTGEHRIDTAGTQRFAPLHTNGDLTGTGPQPAATGPQSAASDLWSTGPALGMSGTAPQPVIRDGPATGPQPAVADTSWSTGPVSRPEPAPEPAPTGPLSVVRDAAPPPAEPEVGVAPRTGEHGLPTRVPSRDHDLPSRRDSVRSPSGVIVPPAEGAAEESRLPIFEAVESDWFRRVRRAMPTTGQDGEIRSNGNGWSSPADDGWRAAEVVQAPSSEGVTPAGLPKRTPRANLVPGTAQAPSQPAPPVLPARSAAATRDRFASYQQGVRRARAAASENSGDGGNGGEDGADGTSR